MPGLTLVTAPSVEPITLSEAKLFAKIDVPDDDTLVTDLIAAARKRVETWKGWALIQQDWDLFLDAFPGPLLQVTNPSEGWTSLSGDWTGQSYWASAPILVPRPPIISVTYVKYTDYNGNIVTLTSGPDYQVDASGLDLNGEPTRGRIAPPINKTWPITQLQALNGVNVRFRAGFGAAAANVPEQIRTALKELVGYWYYNRNAIGSESIPDSVGRILQESVGGFALA